MGFRRRRSKAFAGLKWKRGRQGIDEVHENKFVRKDGSPLWTLVNSKSLFDKVGEFTGVLGMLTDITERKQAEEVLRASEARFRSVLDNSRDVIYRLNVQTDRYEYISPSAEEMTGFTLDEFMAMDAKTALSMIHPDDLPAMRESVERYEKILTKVMQNIVRRQKVVNTAGFPIVCIKPLIAQGNHCTGTATFETLLNVNELRRL